MKKLLSLFGKIYWLYFAFVSTALLLLALFLPGLFREDVLTLGGSTSVFILFDGLSDLSKKKDIPFVYNSMGSLAGLRRVKKKTFLVGFVSKKLEDNELPNGFKKFELAKDGIVIIYHLPNGCLLNNNQIQLNFSVKQLQKIFQKKKAYWSDVDGVTCVNSQKKIHRINRENGSGTRIVFETEIIEKLPSSKGNYNYETQKKSSSAVLNDVNGIEGAIAYISFSYMKKIKKVMKKNRQINFASLEKVVPHLSHFKPKPGKEFADYFLSRPFSGLYLAQEEPKLKKFFEFLQDSEVQKKIEKLGFVYSFNKDES